MDRRERARFSPEFRDEAVRLVIESGRPIAQIAPFDATEKVPPPD